MKKRKVVPINQDPFFDERGSFRFRPVSSDAQSDTPFATTPTANDVFERFEPSCATDCCGVAALVFEPPTPWDKDTRWNFDYDVVKMFQSEMKRAEALEAEVVRCESYNNSSIKMVAVLFALLDRKPGEVHPLENMKKRSQVSVGQAPYFDEEGCFKPRLVLPDKNQISVMPPLPPRLWTFFERFKSSCTFDCCGLSALAFKPPIEWDKCWNFNPEVFSWLQVQLEKTEPLEEEVIRLPAFRQDLYKDDYLFLLRYLMENMEKSKQWK